MHTWDTAYLDPLPPELKRLAWVPVYSSRQDGWGVAPPGHLAPNYTLTHEEAKARADELLAAIRLELEGAS